MVVHTFSQGGSDVAVRSKENFKISYFWWQNFCLYKIQHIFVWLNFIEELSKYIYARSIHFYCNRGDISKTLRLLDNFVCLFFFSKQSRTRSEGSYKSPLIWFYSVCICPFKSILGINGLKVSTFPLTIAKLDGLVIAALFFYKPLHV